MTDNLKLDNKLEGKPAAAEHIVRTTENIRPGKGLQEIFKGSDQQGNVQDVTVSANNSPEKLSIKLMQSVEEA